MSLAKRAFDFLCATGGLVLLSPAFVPVALAIWLGDRGPVFYLQERVGRGGKPFRIWKFRTMRVNADREGLKLTVGRDPRITAVGAFLRKTKLDELPQLLNVVKGEMSLVGPRPEVAKYVELYGEAELPVLDLTPGITDPASLRFRNESEILAAEEDPERAYIERIMPEKARMNLEYAARASVLRDAGLVIATLRACVTPERRER